MKTIEQECAKKHHGDVFEELIQNKSINYIESIPNNLDEWTELIIKMVSGMDIELIMGDVIIAEPKVDAPPSRSFKVFSSKRSTPPFIYVDTFPVTKQFLYVSDLQHHESINADVILAWHFGGGKVICRDNGTSILEVNNVTIYDKRTIADRKNLAKCVARSWPRKG